MVPLGSGIISASKKMACTLDVTRTKKPALIIILTYSEELYSPVGDGILKAVGRELRDQHAPLQDVPLVPSFKHRS
jgi:hypothetical protein